MSVLTSPHLIDTILALTVIEGAVLAIFRLLAVRSVVRMLLPGLLVMLALRAALADSAWPFVPAALTAALIAHIFDLRARVRGWS
jgi:hypothetical protein